MLSSDKKRLLDELLAASNKEELAWINGYLSGILLGGEMPQATTMLKPAINKITITYGTETGHSKKLASDFAAKAKRIGINAKLVSLDQYRLKHTKFWRRTGSNGVTRSMGFRERGRVMRIPTPGQSPNRRTC